MCILMLMLSLSTVVQSNIITGDIFGGPGNSTITTTVDTTNRIVTYKISGLDIIYGDSLKEIDFNINTLISALHIERDPSTLSRLDRITPGTMRELNGRFRWGTFFGTPEVSRNFKNGDVVLKGVDGSFSKRSIYYFGVVYDEAFIFNNIWQSSTMQINSIDYVFLTPTIISNVPLPESQIMFIVAIVSLMLINIRRPLKNKDVHFLRYPF